MSDLQPGEVIKPCLTVRGKMVDSWNIFKKPEPIPVPDFTVGMLIASARAGRWLYD